MAPDRCLRGPKICIPPAASLASPAAGLSFPVTDTAANVSEEVRTKVKRHLWWAPILNLTTAKDDSEAEGDAN